MLTRLIVNLYGWIIEIFLWIMLLVASIVGYNNPVPMLKDSGPIVESEVAWKIFCVLFYPAIAFLAFAVIFGPILVLIDIRKSVRALETASNREGGAKAQAFEFREPHL